MSRAISLLRKKSFDALAAPPGSLRRVLGPVDLTLLGVGAIIGAGIFVLTGLGAVTAGPGLMLSFVIAGAAAMLAALCYAEFSSLVPAAGSVYTYSYAVLGELVAWIIGWDLILEYGIVASTAAAGWSGYLQSLLTQLGLGLPIALTAAPGALDGVKTWLNLPALLLLLGIGALLAAGIRESARANNWMVALKGLVILLLIVVAAPHVEPENWHPFMPFGTDGVFAAAALVFFSYIGFDAVTTAAEEARNPQRDLPIGLLTSLLICTVLYVLVTAVMTGIVPYQRFAGAAHPVSLAVDFAQIGWLARLIDVAALAGMFTVVLTMSYGGIRVLFAIARDGLLPPVLGSVDRRRATPATATWLFCIASGLFASLVPLRQLAELANIGTLSAFALIALATIVLRIREPSMPRHFRCPGVPITPLLAIAACLFLIAHLHPHTWLRFGVWMAIGLALYAGYGYRHSRLHPGAGDEVH